MPGTPHDIKVKNNAFANDVRKGKTAVRPSQRQKAEKRTPLSTIALGIVAFVVFGGIIFELVQVLLS